MNIQTLRKLAKNPHYKLSAEQKRQLAEAEAQEGGVRIFGKPPIHNVELQRTRGLGKKKQ